MTPKFYVAVDGDRVSIIDKTKVDDYKSRGHKVYEGVYFVPKQSKQKEWLKTLKEL